MAGGAAVKAAPVGRREGYRVTRRNFTIMDTDRTLRYPRTVRWHVPWAMLAEHEPQALSKHGQTLERLASRGGLGPDEAMAILDGRRWQRMDEDEAREKLKARVAEWEAKA